MKNLDKYLSLLGGEVDGLLLTSRYSRHYGAEFDIAEGIAIVTYYSVIPTQQMEDWLRAMPASGIQLCIVSNSKSDRVQRFCRERNLDCIIRAKKPRGKGIRECLAKYDIPASQAALAGDQIFTDVLGANAQGVTSILVDAIHNHNIWFKGRHVLELPFIFLARKRRINP